MGISYLSLILLGGILLGGDIICFDDMSAILPEFTL